MFLLCTCSVPLPTAPAAPESEETLEVWLIEAQWSDAYRSPVGFTIEDMQLEGPAGGTWKPNPNVPYVPEAKLYKGRIHTWRLAQLYNS